MSLSEFCEKCEDCKWIRRFCFQTKFEKCVELVKVCKLDLLTQFTRKTIFDKLFHSWSYMRLILHPDCEKHIFDRISSNTHLNLMGLVSLCSIREILSYELKLFFWVLVKISSSVHGFVVVQPMFTKFDSFSNFEPYQDWKTSTSLTHMHTQAFKKISQLVNFKLSSCDLSPPLKPVAGGSSKFRKMSYM